MRNFYEKILYYLCLITLVGIGNPSFSLEINTDKTKISGQLIQNTELSIDDIEQLFKQNLQLKDSVIYNQVPRGLIVSINSSVFFDEGADELKEYSKQTLDIIGKMIKSIDKPCVIEGHTKYNSLKNADYTHNWEISTVRAEKIVDYLIKNSKLNPKKIRAIGFGEMIPQNTYTIKENSNARIDFVIFICPSNIIPCYK